MFIITKVKKTLIFLSLILVTCQALAADRSYLVGEHRSTLHSKVGQPKEKMENSLTGKSIWTYEDFKILIKNDRVIQVKNLNEVVKVQATSSQVANNKALTQPEDLSKKDNPKDLSPELFGDIMKELETKAANTKEVANSKNPPSIGNSLQSNMLKFKQ